MRYKTTLGLFILVAGWLLGTLPYNLQQRVNAVPAPEPVLGCCTLCGGGEIGQVSRPSCFNQYGGVSWSAGSCSSNLGCCLLGCGSRIDGITQSECFNIHGGVDWYSGGCN